MLIFATCGFRLSDFRKDSIGPKARRTLGPRVRARKFTGNIWSCNFIRNRLSCSVTSACYVCMPDRITLRIAPAFGTTCVNVKRTVRLWLRRSHLEDISRLEVIITFDLAWPSELGQLVLSHGTVFTAYDFTFRYTARIFTRNRYTLLRWSSVFFAIHLHAWRVQTLFFITVCTAKAFVRQPRKPKQFLHVASTIIGLCDRLTSMRSSWNMRWDVSPCACLMDSGADLCWRLKRTNRAFGSWRGTSCMSESGCIDKQEHLGDAGIIGREALTCVSPVSAPIRSWTAYILTCLRRVHASCSIGYACCRFTSSCVARR